MLIYKHILLKNTNNKTTKQNHSILHLYSMNGKTEITMHKLNPKTHQPTQWCTLHLLYRIGRRGKYNESGHMQKPTQFDCVKP
jgi:hypothetical protein